MTLTYGSLCSGYGGLDLAVEATFGATPLWHFEVDPHASKVLAAHWPDVPNHGDLTAIDWTTVPPVDVVCAGWPCQPFSTAGQRKGTDDDRHLWPYIADALRVLRPRYLVGENVAGHVSLGFDAVLADLAAIGFDAEWVTVRASDVGACHRRERLFVLAADTDRGRLTQQSQLHGGADEVPALQFGAEPGATRRHPERHHLAFPWEATPYAQAVSRWERVTRRPAPDPTVDRRLSPRFVEWMMGLDDGWVTGHGLSRTAELKCLGNGVVPQQAVHAISGLLDRLER